MLNRANSTQNDDYKYERWSDQRKFDSSRTGAIKSVDDGDDLRMKFSLDSMSLGFEFEICFFNFSERRSSSKSN